MSRLLSLPTLDAEPRVLSAPAPALDAFTRARVEEAAKAAYDQGRRDGAADARTEAAAAAERVTAALAQARDAAVAELASLRAEQAHATVSLATAIAEAVLGREPHDGGQALLARVRDALASLDDAPLVVRVHADDLDAVAAGVLDERVSVEVDPRLAPGEGRITGPWAQADLTREAAWGAVRAVLAVEEGADDA